MVKRAEDESGHTWHRRLHSAFDAATLSHRFLARAIALDLFAEFVRAAGRLTPARKG